MANKITDFYPGTTKKFTVTCSINGVAQDITADTVTFRMKIKRTDKDTEAVLTEAADVATQGADGIAIFELSDIETTAVGFGKYFCDVVWDLAGGAEYIIYDNTIEVLTRVSDV